MILRYAGDGASSRVRGIELAGAMRRAGGDVEILAPDDPSWRRRYYGAAFSRRVLYVQKRLSERDAAVARLRRALRLPTVFDLDDAPGGVAQEARLEALAARMMRLSTAVTVGSRALREFASRHNSTVEVIPSAVDTEVFIPADRTGDVATVGWIGNGAGYAAELADLARVVARVRSRVRVRVVVVGAVGRPDVHAAFGHEDDVVVDSVDWRSEDAIAAAMREFDIGVYPLRDTRYNSYKCGYKAIQYMALGIPVVASPTGETPHIVGDGESGYLARTDEEWVERLCELARDPSARRRLGQAGRRVVVERYSLARAAELMRALVERIAR